MNTKKGFTLLELLIVIGILAILSTTIVLVINPAELLAKARDSQRISDLNTLKTAIAFYLTETADPEITDGTHTSYCYVADVVCDTGSSVSEQSQKVNGDGWIPINFSAMPGGSPISVLPIDPVNEKASHLYYVYFANQAKLTFKLMANMESKYYGTETPTRVVDKDGGKIDTLYEVGTDLNLGPTSTLSGCFKD
ncbi:MAG: type II secretion system protein [Candidatus Pacebacteria bacterium]|nr:type II secretion system protein [Candidatus Paceibacterota bacterium]